MKRTLVFLLAATTACAAPIRQGAPAGANPGATASGASNAVIGDSIPLALRWYRSSAEMHALFVQTYRTATESAQRLAASQAGQAWGVIMDADETVLDNSMYQQGRGGRAYTAETWETWVRTRKAAPLPGAADFINRVRALGGKVVIVTNREDNVCADTEQNLRAVGLNVDQVLCKPVGVSDKNPRFAAVESGTAPSRLPPMKVLMWLGDNIQDFPGLTQAVRTGGAAGFSEFGKSWFVLPNPLYGSWERNTVP